MRDGVVRHAEPLSASATGLGALYAAVFAEPSDTGPFAPSRCAWPRRKLCDVEPSGPAPGDYADLPAAADADVVVRTFLIADVRGYTRFTQSRGDEEAGKLAATFAALTRDAMAPHGGELIELRGDEALCAFQSARQALRAAIELQIRFRERVDGEPVFPLGIGVGLAAGEAVPVEGGYRGGALNLAARLCSVAAPGQILASDTVTSLAGRFDGARFLERRAIRLKGLEKPIRPIEVVPEVELPPLPDAPAPTRRRRAPLLAGAALVLVAAAATAFLVVPRDSDEADSIGNAIAAVDGDGSVSYTASGTTPSTIAVGEGAVWVLERRRPHDLEDRSRDEGRPDVRNRGKPDGPRRGRGRRVGWNRG